MKKRVLAMMLAVMMLFSTVSVSAYTKNQKNTADALNHLGLFLGKGGNLGYDLDAKLNRNQGVILLVRMLGMEKEAMKGGYAHPFKDVPKGATAHVAYAYTNKIVNGYTASVFGGSDTMTDKMFLALSLRALGYSDKGENADFIYKESRQKAYELGLVDNPAYDSNFTRGEAVEVFWRIMGTPFKGQQKTLGDRLIEQGVITRAEWEEAKEIQKNGKPSSENEVAGGTASGGSSSGGSTSGGSSSGSSGNGTTTDGMTWEEYQAMTPAEQQAYFDSFANPADFFAWQKAAKEAYDEKQNVVEVKPDGSVDIGELS